MHEDNKRIKAVICSDSSKSHMSAFWGFGVYVLEVSEISSVFDVAVHGYSVRSKRRALPTRNYREQGVD